jgi:hypothetical protein
MARENVMSTPIFDQLLREMAQRADPRVPTPPTPTSAAATPAAAPSPTPTQSPSASPEPPPTPEAEQVPTTPRRRHRAD